MRLMTTNLVGYTGEHRSIMPRGLRGLAWRLLGICPMGNLDRPDFPFPQKDDVWLLEKSDEIKIRKEPINISECKVCGTKVTTFRPLTACIWCDGVIEFD